MAMATVKAADGAALAYEIIGDDVVSDVIVLVHGITGCAAEWDPVINRLAPGRNVGAVDLRGHGQSERKAPYDVFTMANDLETVVRAIGVDDPLMVGHSLGGMVVTVYAAAGHPTRGVVNVDQPIETSGFKDALTLVEPMLRGSTDEFNNVIEQMFGTMYGPLAASERARVEHLGSPEQEVVLGVWDTVFNTGTDDLRALSAQLAQGVKVPYLALLGGDAPGYREWLSAHMPGVHCEVWPDHGHFPHLVDPDRFVARIEAFDAQECR